MIRLEAIRLERRAFYVGAFVTRAHYGGGILIFACPLPFVSLRFRIGGEREPVRDSWGV